MPPAGGRTRSGKKASSTEGSNKRKRSTSKGPSNATKKKMDGKGRRSSDVVQIAELKKILGDKLDARQVQQRLLSPRGWTKQKTNSTPGHKKQTPESINSLKPTVDLVATKIALGTCRSLWKHFLCRCCWEDLTRVPPGQSWQRPVLAIST